MERNKQRGRFLIEAKTKVVGVIDNPIFEHYGRLIFPTAFGRPSSFMTLDEVGSMLLYHNYINTETTIDVIRTMEERRIEGKTIFYDIYSEQEKRRDPEKRDTGPAVRMRPVRIWREPSALFLNMQESWKLTQMGIRSGAAPQGHGWLPGWAALARMPSEKGGCRGRRP